MTPTRLSWASIDDHLGPGATRFFGAGYRRAEYDVRDVRLGAELSAEVSVGYPADWSRKSADVDLRPHLSSVDTLVLGAQLAEALLAARHRLDGPARRRMRLRKVTLRAGMAPVEDLVGLPASAAVTGTGAADGGLVSVVDTAVGAMRARVEVEHPVDGGMAWPDRARSLPDLLGPAARRYYGDGFRGRALRLCDVDADTVEHVATAVVRREDPAADGGEGIEGASQPSVSMVDCFVVCLQLSQVLMYELDSLTRGSSNTLWMMQTTLTAADRARPWHRELPARTAITGNHLLPLRGQTWRNVDVAGELGGVAMRSSLAHRLPDPTTGRTS